MPKSMLSAIAIGIGGSAVAGFGLAAGRDTYGIIRRNRGSIILIAALAAAVSLPFVGMLNLFRGQAPGEWWKGVGFLMLVPAGLAIGARLGLLAGTFFGEGSLAVTIVVLLGAAAVAALLGAALGLSQRPATKRKYALIARNEAFLTGHGITETGEDEITHYDGDGNALRVLERTANSIVFMAVGKRNKRRTSCSRLEGK